MRSSGIAQELTRYRPHRPRQPKGRKRPAKQWNSMRSILAGAVGNGTWQSISNAKYRPQENPAKRYITDGAVDAGGILRRLLRTLLYSSFAASLPTEVPSKPP